MSTSCELAGVGQDEAVSGGTFGTPLLRVDAFYPLPLAKDVNSNGKWRLLYIFATASLKLSGPDNKPPLVLNQLAAGTVNGASPDVSIVARASNRGVYRIGFGVDLANLLKSVFSKD